MRSVFAFVAVLGVGLLAGCGPNCQSTCSRAYLPSECGLEVPGMTHEELFDDCVEDCEYALKHAGELDGYDPNIRNTTGEIIELKNDKQAAAWMDCVSETACEDLDIGYCSPI